MKWILDKLDLVADMIARVAGSVVGVAIGVAIAVAALWVARVDLSWMAYDNASSIVIAAFIGSLIGSSTRS
tara:strand:+ start:653 stop:865 length:213 start_codon:yes stop_codon:yes gene_type:complete